MSKLIKVFFLSIVLIFATVSVALAQETSSAETIEAEATEAINLDEDIKAEDLGISEPTLLPNNRFYFLKNWGRAIQSTFTFDPVKKTELNLKFANEKLMEAKKLIEQKPSDEAGIKALNNYSEEIEKIKKGVAKRNLKIDNPKVEIFLEKLTDQNFKQQKLLDRLEKKVSQETSEDLKKIKERALEKITTISLGIASPEKFKEKIEKIIDQQKGSNLKHIKNLEVLMGIENKVPQAAKEAIQKAQTNTLKRLEDDFLNIPDQEKPILKEYLKRIGGNEVLHLEIISELEEREIPSVAREIIEQSKEESTKRIGEKLKEFKGNENERIDNYLKSLKKGEIGKLKVIKELEDNLTPETARKIIKIKNQATNEFQKKIKEIKTPEAKEIFLKKIEAVPSIKTFEILKEMEETIAPEKKEFFKEIQGRTLQNLKKRIEGAKTDEEREIRMEALSSGSVEASEIIEKLELPSNIKTGLRKIEAKKIERKIQQIQNPERLKILREKIELKKIKENVKGIKQTGKNEMLKQIKKENEKE